MSNYDLQDLLVDIFIGIVWGLVGLVAAVLGYVAYLVVVGW